MGEAFAGGPERKTDKLVAGLVEGYRSAFGAVYLHGTVDLDRNGGVLYAVFKGEHVDRQGDILAYADHARKGGHHHEGRAHGHRLFGVAVGSVLTGHQHDADATDIHRELDVMRIALAVEGEGTEELDNGVETVVLLGAEHAAVFVTADTQHRREGSAEAADDVVVDIPGAYSESFAPVHVVPRIGGLEAGDVQQAFVHDRKGVGHVPAVLLGYLYREVLFGMDRIRHGEHGLEMRVGIFHHYRLDAVEADGCTVIGLIVRPYEADVHVEVGSHLLSDLEGEGSELLAGFHPFLGDDAGTVLERHEGPAVRSLGNVDRGCFAYGIGLLVEREAEHVHRSGVLVVAAALVGRPVDKRGHARSMPAVTVFHVDEVPAPILFGNVDGEGGRAVSGDEPAGGVDFRRRTVHVGTETVQAVLPPPAPADAVYLVLHVVACHGLAVFGEQHHLDGVVLVGE